MGLLNSGDSYMGIDIGSTSIKIVELNRNEDLISTQSIRMSAFVEAVAVRR